MESLFLGIDLGTSAVKAVLVDESGQVIASGHAESRVHQPRPSWQEQELDPVWESVKEAVGRALNDADAGRVRALSLSAAMHGMMAIDARGRALMPMLTWADGRSAAQAEKLAEEHDRGAIFARTGCPVTALYYPARLKWLKEHLPRVFDDAYGRRS